MTLKVLTYNILLGGQNRLLEIAAVIREQQPDVVALQETMQRANAERLADLLGMHLTFGEANNDVHVAWLSRLPVVRSQNHQLAALAKTLLEIEVVWMDAALYLFTTHLASRHDQTTPLLEVAAILDALHHRIGQPHLLLGDFNALRPGDPVGDPPPGVEKWGEAADGAPRRAIRPLIEAGYSDCYRTLHPATPGYTYPSAMPWLRLDYVFASPQMATCLSAGGVVTSAVARRASDHLPVVAEFQ